MKIIIPSEDPHFIETDLPPLTPRQEIKREVAELVKMVVLFLIIFWGLKTFCIEGYEVQGLSMYPTLEDRERVLVLKFPQQLSRLAMFDWMEPVQPGDIIVFNTNDKHNKRFIKRVIAEGPHGRSSNTVAATAPEETPSNSVKVEFRQGKVYVNKLLVEENYLLPEEKISTGEDELDLNPGEYYVLGDHRSASRDSRLFHAVQHDQIIGKALLRFWPLNKFGLL